MPLLQHRATYKPFEYPWAFEAWQIQQNIHWLPQEVPLIDDITDWHFKLSKEEKHLITQIFRFFTQSDVEVANCYHRHYLNYFKPTEIRMMLGAFSNTESTHIAAYAYLLDTLGLPEVEYEAFLKYKEMKAKHEYLDSFDPKDKFAMAETMAVFGGFTEGMALFGSFEVLLNFPRWGKMKEMGQIITWSVRDETLHCFYIIKLFHTFLQENRDINRQKLGKVIARRCEEMVSHEDAFIDLAFELGGVQGLEAKDVKQYIRYISDIRLCQLDLPPMFHVKTNPTPWVDEFMNGAEFGNFFDTRVTDYAKCATEGEWSEVWAELDDTLSK